MNWKGYGRKQSRPNIRHYPGIWLEGLRKTTKSLSRVNWSRGPKFEFVISRTGSRRADRSTATFHTLTQLQSPNHTHLWLCVTSATDKASQYVRKDLLSQWKFHSNELGLWRECMSTTCFWSIWTHLLPLRLFYNKYREIRSEFNNCGNVTIIHTFLYLVRTDLQRNDCIFHNEKRGNVLLRWSTHFENTIQI
jgi:hypothetical protein